MVEYSPEKLDTIFHALADPTRRAMLRQLADREQTVGELASPFPMSLAAVSKHVRILERAGLIRRSVRGRKHVCRLSPQPLEYAVEWLKTSQQFWEERLDALEEHLALHDHE